nr:SusC/RagA family TonB-linked outer membrane protein [uncultured Flavobacterium sp.]
MKNFSFYKGGKTFYYLILTGTLLFFSSIKADTFNRNIQLLSQQFQIQGTVSDGTAPLPGVSIAIKNKSKVTTVSDYDGQYTLFASQQDTLVFSYIGYKTAIVPIQGRSTIDISLQLDATTLQEVKVNAGYYSVKEKERTGSISRITSSDIEKQPVSNVLATMQGRMAGVNITQDSGLPGGGFSIEIRGRNSLRSDGNNPLYIINGVPYSSQDIGSAVTSGSTPSRANPLNSINPGDIANIEVLKDADATAIYGSRGANGVVLITTKKGKEGKTTFTTNYQYGLGQAAHFMDLMNTSQYLSMRREAYANDGITNYPATAYDVNGTWDQTRDANWQKELLGGNASYMNLQSSLSGGSAQTQFLLSGSYNKETTILPGDFNYVKANGHANVNHESENKKFRINFTAGYTAQFNDLPILDITRNAITLPPNAPPLYDADGNINWADGTFDNPIAYLQGNIKSETYDFISNALFSYDLGLGFTAKSSFGYTDLRQEQKNLLPSTIYNPAYGLGSESTYVYTNNLNRSSWIIEPQLSWSYNEGKSKIEALIGSTFQEQNSSQLVSSAVGFSSNSLMENPASAAEYLVESSDETLYKYQAFFARVNFNWQGKYILNLTGRRDGSSRFGPGKQYATFGAVGAAWVFGEESFIKTNLPFLSFGKLRASYGTSGNDQIGDYQYLDTYSTSGSTYQGIAGMQPTRLFNPDFGWETNKKLEFALETGFLNDRIFLTAGWFRNRSSNQLVGIPLPGTTGFSSLQANLNAEVENSGLELSLRGVLVKQKDFSWTANFNLTNLKNKLLSFPGLEASTYKEQYVIGQPLNIIKVYEYTGLNTNTGAYQFKDVDGDGVLSAVDDKKTIKYLSPEYYGGLENQFRYGNLQLDFLFQFVKQTSYNENYQTFMPGTQINQVAGVTQHWQQPGDTGPSQVYSATNGALRAASTRFSQSDAAIGDASYIRLKNVALSFDLPKNWTKKFNCKLSLEGQNLFTITAYKGMDPEFKYPGYMPPLRIITTGIQLTF